MKNIFSILCAAILSTCCLAFNNPSNEHMSRKQSRWIPGGPTIISMKYPFHFNYTDQYNVNNPCFENVTGPEGGGFISNSQFYLSSEDTTNKNIGLMPLKNFWSRMPMMAEGETKTTVQSYRTNCLPKGCNTYNCGITLNQCSPYLRLANNENPRIEKGILLWRSFDSNKPVPTKWDNYIHLDEITDKGAVALNFKAGKSIQFCTLYEVEYWNGKCCWPLKKTQYYHLCGIYGFEIMKVN